MPFRVDHGQMLPHQGPLFEGLPAPGRRTLITRVAFHVPVQLLLPEKTLATPVHRAPVGERLLVDKLVNAEVFVLGEGFGAGFAGEGAAFVGGRRGGILGAMGFAAVSCEMVGPGIAGIATGDIALVGPDAVVQAHVIFQSTGLGEGGWTAGIIAGQNLTFFPRFDTGYFTVKQNRVVKIIRINQMKSINQSSNEIRPCCHLINGVLRLINQSINQSIEWTNTPTLTSSKKWAD